MNNVTAINRARIMQLAEAAIAAIQALLEEVGPPARLPVQPPVRPPKPQREIRYTPTPQCPDCGGEMKTRTSQRGPFWGCKQYPHCKGTRPGGTERDPNSSYAAGNSDEPSDEERYQ